MEPSHNSSSTLNLEDLSTLFREIKFNNNSVNERFDLELFTLGYITALQSLHGVNKLNSNIEELVYLRNLEADNKITRQEKLEALSEIVKLTTTPLSPSHLSSQRIVPEKWANIKQRVSRKQEENDSPTIHQIVQKRSKSNEGKKLLSFEKVSRPDVGAGQGVCCICGTKMKGINYAKLQSCGHTFHDNCLRAHLARETDRQVYPIRCPAESCGREIEPTTLQGKLDPERAKMLWDYSFVRNIKKPDNTYSWCPTQGCKYFYVAAKPLLMMFRCPLCQKHYCLNCRAEYHRGQTCDTFQKCHGIQTPKLDKDFVRFKQCPKCQKWAEYEQGNRLQCNYCNANFCVNCGEGPVKCECELVNDIQGGNREHSGSDDLIEETLLYKMIMQDQEDEKVKIQQKNKAHNKQEETKEKDVHQRTSQAGNLQYS